MPAWTDPSTQNLPPMPTLPRLTLLNASLAVATLVPAGAAEAPKAPSAGLLNDWLRVESPDFKAWDIGGQVRTRYEVFDNGPSFEFPSRDFQKVGVDNDNAYFLLREKVHLGYTPVSWLTAYVEARDSSSTGDDHSKNPGTDTFDLQEAYLSLGNAKEFPLTAKVGRQTLLYADERVIGAGDWGNVPRSFDAAKVRFENKDVWVDAFAGRVVQPVDGTFNTPDDNDWFSGVYASSKTLLPWQETQLYFLSRNSSPGAAVSPRDIYSLGLRVKSLPGKFGGWDYAGEFVKQLGSVNQGGVRREQDAFAGNVGGGYAWAKSFGAPRIALDYSYATGDSDPTDGTSETLDNLFPTNHKFYGYMDLVGWRNIHNPRVLFSLKPAKSLTLTLDYQLYWLADTHDFFYPQGGAGRAGNGYGRNPQFDSFVGSETNFDLTYAPTAWLGFRAGYGHFFTGSYVDSSKAAVGGSTDADWVYLQTTFNF